MFCGLAHGRRARRSRSPPQGAESNLIVLEATGGFETVVVAALAAAGLPVAVANPAQIRAFAKTIGQRTKTDPIDAGVIAHFGWIMQKRLTSKTVT